jgi:hypothetical protein
MRLYRIGSLCALGMLALGAAQARAQLVFGTTSPTATNSAAMYFDVSTMQVTTLWNSAANKKVNGLAADPASGRLYANDAARLNYWNYNSIGTPPTFIAGMYRTNDNVTFTATGVDGLAFANGNLYASTKFGSTVYKRGIYQVSTTADNLSPPHCVMSPLWLDPTGVGTLSGTIALDGLDFNASDGLFYAAQGADTTGTGGSYTRGIYTVDAFGSGALTKIASFPAGRTAIDGLAIGGGKIWLTEQEPGASRIDIYPYDIATGTYDATIYVPLTDATQRASGAAWAPGAFVPEPVTSTMLALFGLAALRRQARSR